MSDTYKYTLKDARESIASIADQLEYGCGDGHCKILRPRGMHTNATCQCSPRDISRHLLDIAAEIEAMGKEWVK